MKGFSKYRKYILAGFVFMQIFMISIPASAYEVFSSWDDIKNYIYKNMEDRKEKINFIYNGDKTDYGLQLKEAVKETYSKDDYMERSWTEIKPEAYDLGIGIETTISIRYLCTKEQEDYVDRELKKATSSIINDNMSDYDKVNAINRYIIDRYEYDYDLKSLSVYSALTTSETVCQGYSMTAYKMFNYAGIKNRIIVGTARGTSHSWNLVKIDGKWYHIDITNNDSGNIYKYFLVSDQFLINNNYKWDSKMYPLSLEDYSTIDTRVSNLEI